MKRIAGFVVGILWIGFAFVAFSRAATGWAADQADIGFWWTVIGCLLAIAALGALVGTWIHTRDRSTAH